VELAIRLNDVYEQFDIYTSMQQAYLVNVDKENALYMSKKIGSLISVSSDERLQISALEKLAREALGQQNLDLAEHYLLDREVLLGKLGYRDRILLGYLVYSALQDFYTAKKDFEKAIKFSRLYIETSKVGLGNTPMAYMSYGREALVYAYQKNKEKAFADLDTMKTGIWKYGETNLSAKLQYYEIEGNIHGMFEEWGAAYHSYKNGLALVEGTYVKYRDAYFRNHLKLGTALYHLKKNDEARDCFANYTS
jgi:tetratricopeptide (TPR) repeat protein